MSLIGDFDNLKDDDRLKLLGKIVNWLLLIRIMIGGFKQR